MRRLASALLVVIGLLASAPERIAAAQQNPEDGRGQGVLTSAWHAERRATLRSEFLERASDKSGVVILRGALPKPDYRAFYQDNNFWYFTGVTSPNAIYVMVPETGREVFFIPSVSARLRRWDGDIVDPDMARRITGIEDCRPLASSSGPFGAFEELLEELAVERRTFYIQLKPGENWMMSRDYLTKHINTAKQDPYDGRMTREEQFQARLEERHGVTVRDLSNLFDRMRAVKTAEEIELLREACRVSGEAHVAAMRSARPGMYEWQVAAIMTSSMLHNGARTPAYAPIVGSGLNACVLHYKENKMPLDRGEVVMIDYGADFHRYDADISRSWPVDAQFTPRQKEVYEAVLAAQEAAFEQCRPGRSIGDVHEAAARKLAQLGFGPLVHGTSHWIGLGTHDVAPRERSFKPGMVFTVEPGIYLDDEELGVRIEDVVLITEDGYEILSAMIPRQTADIEALRAEAWGN